MNSPLRTFLPLSLSLAAFANPAAAQEASPEPIDAVVKRVRAGGDLIEMQWRRDASGRLSTCPKGSDDWQPLVHDSLARTFGATGSAGFLMAWLQGDNDVLGMTDGERHLHRAGVGTADPELRMFLAAPLPEGVDARHAAVLDRMIAVDLLRRRAAKSAVADLGALAKREDLPDPLRRRAQDAVAALQGGTRVPPAQLDPATLPLPVAADGYVILDNTRIPDTSRLADLGRRMGLLSSLAVLKILKAPTPQDWMVGQTESDAIGELPFEFARRFGNYRIQQYCLAVQWQPQASPSVGFCLQAVGEFDVPTLTRALPEELRDSGVEIEPAAAALKLKSEEGECLIEPSRITAATKAMRGKPRPELAKTLLAPGTAGIRIVVPPNSKAWLALAALELPPALDGEVAVTFQPTFSVRATITARDEDAAEGWVKRVQALLAEHVPTFEAQLTVNGPALAPVAEVIAALRAITVAAEDKVVTVELTGKTFGWPTLEALMLSSQPH